MSYMAPPGLYAIGVPTPNDPVVVTANYKMSFDLVRQSLDGRNVWLLVLETFGINVWCAAGKGTFGTDELVRRIEKSRLGEAVHHRTLLLPILGAPGVAAHEVTRRTGFHIRYAAIRAADLPTYLDNGMVTEPAMRELSFTFFERLVLVPVELVHALKPTLLFAVLLFLAAAVLGFGRQGMALVLLFLGAVLAGTVVTPLLLPWLPGRSFAAKGAIVGVAWGIAWHFLSRIEVGFPIAVGTVLALGAVSSFYALNFTGSTPFTSRSGVRKEMRLSLPTMCGTVVLAALFWVWGGLF